MAQGFRIECRYCSNPIVVEASQSGQRIKCPKCHNALTIPALGEGEEKPGQRAGPGGTMAAGGTKEVARRPVAPSGGGQFLGRLIKIAIVLALAAGAWFGWDYYQGQKEKPIGQLFEEFASDKATRELNKRIILEKAGPENLTLAESYAKNSDPEVRALAAAVMGVTRREAAHRTLATMATKDKEIEVRRAACTALGKIRIVESVDTLIEVLAKEKEDEQVKGDAKGALAELTGMKFVQHDEWVKWWRETKSDFSMKDPAK